jgi:protein SCO1
VAAAPRDAATSQSLFPAAFGNRMFVFALSRAIRAKTRACAMRWGLAFLSFAIASISASSQASTTNYLVRGILKEIKKDERQLVITHEAIPNFMETMTMPFNVKESALFSKVKPGEKLKFQLHVTENESWIDHIEKLESLPSIGSDSRVASKVDLNPEAKTNSATRSSNSLLRTYKFTNELGQAVSLSDFRGQALALTFIFTRCPIPEFCPRLTRNFEEVQRKLKQIENAPTNWHLISVTFDPANDTPEVLKAYGNTFQYDPPHWSFLTGPKEKIAEFARACDVQFDPENGLFNHNFRTLIIDTSNRLQMVFPTSGDLSDSIVQELLKAASGGTNPMTQTSISAVPAGPEK